MDDTITDMINQDTEDQGPAQEGIGPEPIEKKPAGIDISGIIEKLFQPTGPGPLEQYQEHVLNFNKSVALARVLRGLTGILNSDLNLAIIDIGIGLLEMFKGKGKKENAVGTEGYNVPGPYPGNR